MSQIEIRLIGKPRDVEAFAIFMTKVEENISALEISDVGTNRPSKKNPRDVLRYMKVDFDTDAFLKSGLNR